MSLDSKYLVFYLALCLLLGFFRVPKIKSLRDYAIGNNVFTTFTLAISMVATMIAPETTIGVAEKGFALGVVYIIPIVLMIFRWWLMGIALGNSLSLLKNNKCMTLVDIMGLFYGKVGRSLCTMSIVIDLLLLGILYKAAGLVLERYLNIPFIYGAAVIAIAIAIYSILGGIHAVVITDVVQFFIFIAVLPCVFCYGLNNIDIPVVLHKVPHDKLTVTSKDIPLLMSLILYGLIPSTGLPFIQRGLMCKDKAQLQYVFNITGVLSCIFVITIAFIGLLSLGMNPEIESDDAIFYFIEQSVSSQVFGFVAIGFLAIIMSTASSSLNSVNIVLVKDVLKPLFPSWGSREIILAQFAGVLVVIISFYTMFIDAHIIDIFWTLENFWDPIISVPLMLGLSGIRIGEDKFKYVVITALVSVLGARIVHGTFDTITWSFGVITSCIATFAFRIKPDDIHSNGDVYKA